MTRPLLVAILVALAIAAPGLRAGRAGRRLAMVRRVADSTGEATGGSDGFARAPLRPWWQRRASGATAVDSADVASRLAALLRSGLPLRGAWEALAASGGTGTALAAAVAGQLGAGIGPGPALRGALVELHPGGLRGAAARLLWLSVALDVCERTGAPLADVLDGCAEAVRAEEAASAERAAATAGPRATALVLAGLPGAGIALGLLLGLGPPSVLVRTPAGGLCLAAGAVLWAGGLAWSTWLVRRAAR